MLREKPDEPKYDLVFNVNIRGGENSGKTSLILRFSENIFRKEKEDKEAHDCRAIVKTISLNNKSVRIQLGEYDEKYKSKKPFWDYIKNYDAFLITVDMTNKKSFDELPARIKEIDRYADRPDIKIIVATKFDDAEFDQYEVKTHDLINYCDGLNIPVTCVNAKTGYNVEKLFINLARLYEIDLKDCFYFVSEIEAIHQDLLDAIINCMPHYRCLAFFQGMGQAQTELGKLNLEIFHHIFSFLSPWEDKVKFSKTIFGKKMEIEEARKVLPLLSKQGMYGSSANKNIQHHPAPNPVRTRKRNCVIF